MWIGKFILGLLGYATGGLAGAIVGLALGQLFDGLAGSALREISSGQVGTGSSDLFLDATFQVMGCIAKADGQVSADEIRGAEQIMQRLGLEADARQRAIENFRVGKGADFDLDGLLQQMRLVFRRRPEAIGHFLEIQIQIAIVDGYLDQKEMQVLARIAACFGIAIAQLEALVRRLQAEFEFEHFADGQSAAGAAGSSRLAKAYEVLDVDAEADDASIKKAYRRLIGKHHPDKLIAQGVPEETLRMATEHSQRIQDAWETIRTARGIR